MKETTGKVKKKNNTFPQAPKINKNSLYSAEQIANEINSFFTDVSLSFTKDIPPVSTGFTGYLMPLNYAIKYTDLRTE